MKQRKIVFLTILSTFLFLMIPQIPAIDFTMTKNHTIESLAESIAIKDKNKNKLVQLINTKLNQVDEKITIFTIQENLQTHISSEKNIPLVIGFLFNFIISIIVFVLNVLIIILSLISSLLNSIIGIIINLIFSVIKKVLNLGTILGGLLNIIANVITGLVAILLNVVVGILALIKDIIIDLIKPSLS
ncbi:MAG: hypothetical protein KGY65_05120 [Candidatus Thermoplasmatota archaeon]|nr:hypothetical protein [Candidatus Thermoplasmatota archaeon]MBS3802114.1 hypothetical protein [Candidatus Thermoplasmatota archaeon]